MKCRDIISDEDVFRVHGNAHFGDISSRAVLNEGVIKYAFGYSTGHTLCKILTEHGLIRKPAPMTTRSALTQKGYEYLRTLVLCDSVLRLVRDQVDA